MNTKIRLVIGLLVLLALLFGVCPVTDVFPTPTPTVEAAPEDGYTVGRPVAGYAHGAKSRCGGKFNWRGQYLGPYCTEVPVSTRGAYWKNGRYYMPALTLNNHTFRGWWIRYGYGANSWRDSIVNWRR
ncbi:MAG TPA: hypothetical protein VM537_01445 [Anaerolineae bacterium]|nr:hypothetical protein [Anaerolineae bacterium]